MSEKRVVVVISDLHLGGGPSDPGDDHVYDQNQLRDFVQEHLLRSPEGSRGEIELFVNGDFLEFAQVRQSAYKLGSAEAWCSEAESLEKLDAILSGHADIFAAMGRFQEPGNVVTIAAGNHDVDLFWPEVQRRIRAAAGDVGFELGAEWCSRFGGRLRIGHGHQRDLANRFRDWTSPFVQGPDGQARLEMCPGTLFMVKFVNWLEGDYPFADNIKPIGALRRILWREDKLGAIAVAWMLSRFSARHPQVTLESGASSDRSRDFPRLLLDAARSDDEVGDHLRAWYRRYVDPNAADAAAERGLLDRNTLHKLLMRVMSEEEPSAWQRVLGNVSVKGGTLGEKKGTLQLAESQKVDDKELFREVAKAELAGSEAQVVVLGHTHLPDTLDVEGGKQYFNPGSWTRYADLTTQQGLTLTDLRDESRYPYSLKYVWAESRDTGVRATLETYREHPGRG
jgi:UDP-2,3-diacylglucosamine pyrophosphatase LpxH